MSKLSDIKNWYVSDNPKWVRVICIIVAIMLGIILSLRIIYMVFIVPPIPEKVSIYDGGSFECENYICEFTKKRDCRYIRNMMLKGTTLNEQPDVEYPSCILDIESSQGNTVLWIWFDDDGKSGVKDSILFMYEDDPGTFYCISGTLKIYVEELLYRNVLQDQE